MRRMADTTAEQLPLSVLHSAVPGRARLAVAGFRHQPHRRQWVEDAFLRVSGVHFVSANPTTGHALVLFDPDRWTLSSLLEAATEALRTETAGGGALDRGQGAGQPSTDYQGHKATIWPSPRRSARGQIRASPEGKGGRAASLPPELAAFEPPWHSLPATEVAKLLAVNPRRGLDSSASTERRKRSGPNRLPEPKEPSLLSLLSRQLFNAPTALLGVGVVLSLATGAVVDGLLIGGVLAANAAIGAATERSGQRAIAALRRAVPINARAVRQGEVHLVDAEKLVPGDVVVLLPGDPVPADARVWEAHRLLVEESALTGESAPVAKTPEPVDIHSPLADRISMLYRGTTVVGGRGRAIVVATGGHTAIGGLHALAAQAIPPPAPLKRDLDRIGSRLALASAGISLGIMGLSLLSGVPLPPAISTAVALGVAALPEGLPATATTVLALGSGRMRQKGTLIRSLQAAETLGSVTVICADKTGTLTENRMSVGEVLAGGQTIRITGPALSAHGGLHAGGHRVSLEENRALSEMIRVGVLCSDAEIAGQRDGDLSIDGSPTEGALLVLALKAGVDVDDLRRRFPRIDRRDRGDGRRYMVTVHRTPEGLVALAKGAPDELLEISDRVLTAGTTVPLDEQFASALRQQNADLAGKAMRVLAFARKEVPEGYGDEELAGGFAWCGLAGLIDPIRPGARDAIDALRTAGIRTVMITGDQAVTAATIARELGLEKTGALHILEAEDLAGMNPEVLRGLVRDVEAFARTPPEMKLAIVRALQANGEIVAMTGDGVNDAPALRASDVGVAMGQRGTELARELSDVVLSTDDFSRMVDAVEEGRLVRANVRRVLHYLLSTNGSEVWAVATAAALGLPLPLTPGQLLWLNLISDLTPALGLATEPGDPDLMRQPPRDPREPIVSPALQRRILGESAAIAAGSLAAYSLGILRYGAGPAARSIAFSSLGTAQLLQVFLARSGTSPALGFRRPLHWPLIAGFGFSALLQAAALLVPSLRGLLGGVALGPTGMLISLAGGLSPIALIEGQRMRQRAAAGGQQASGNGAVRGARSERPHARPSSMAPRPSRPRKEAA